MIDGLSHLLTLRKQNLRPQSVWLSVGIPYKAPKYEHEHQRMELVAHESIAKDDFRAFVNLPVTLYAAEWNQLAADCFEKLKLYASEITVLTPSYEADIGFQWSKAYGTLDLGVIGWLEQFYDAKHTVCRTEKETQERIRLETEARNHLPNPPESYRG